MATSLRSPAGLARKTSSFVAAATQPSFDESDIHSAGSFKSFGDAPAGASSGSAYSPPPSRSMSESPARATASLLRLGAWSGNR